MAMKTKSRIENWRITSGLPDIILFSGFIVLPVYTLYSTETEKEKAGLQAEVKSENQKKTKSMDVKTRGHKERDAADRHTLMIHHG